MNVQLSAQHIEITEAIRDVIEEKMARLRNHFDNMVDVHVNLKVEKLNHTAEATIHVRGHTLFAVAVAEDMYAAIDALVGKLNRQIIKHKEKLKSHHEKEVVHHHPRK